jgi:transglutaminase-like putative cysteine protease
MRFSVTHTTVYRYDAPVAPEFHTFRLRPRDDAAQRLLRYEIGISPAPAGRCECLDQDGNVVIEAWFETPVEQLEVHSSFEVETLRENPFDFLLADALFPPRYPEPLDRALAPYLDVSRERTAVQEFARLVADRAAAGTMAFLTELNRALFDDFGHVVREEGASHPPDETLRAGAGTCRDLAVLFCAVCRSAGLAARFVSGYEREASFQERAYMHAWAEVYLPGGGWRGYDPSQGLAVSTSHVAVAAAADPRLAAPISGSYRGDARSAMLFQIQMQVR